MLIVFIVVMNFLYRLEWIDPRNKAYGLNYGNKAEYPAYTQRNLDTIAASAAATNDRKNMEAVLGRWKVKQGEEKPLLVIVTTSGGGTRSATFTMNVLQRLDSLTGGSMMKKTFLFTGASGGMIGATYFRELYRRRQKDSSIHLQDSRYVDNIAADLLNPTFTSFVTRDVFAPERKFTVGNYSYLRDRGLAFEEALNKNTGKILDKKLGDYQADESAANIPLIMYHTLITRDGKKMLIGTQPLRFMMEPVHDSLQAASTADAIDFTTFFSKQDPFNLRMLTVLRMNATFPVVLPNVWMPTEPVIDIMDGGLRDNYGVETSLRFLTHLQDWIQKNTRALCWCKFATAWTAAGTIRMSLTIWCKTLQAFLFIAAQLVQDDGVFSEGHGHLFLNNQRYPIHNITFQYIPRKEEHKAALSFHLTSRRRWIFRARLGSAHNQESFTRVLQLFGKK